jgi:hypothetical protein
MATGQASPKRGKVIDIPANAPTIGTATDAATGGTVSVPFTAGSTATGGPVFKYTATSTPGSITATATTSPITVTGLTNGTSYTFTVAATNPSGNGPLSSASNSVSPSAPATVWNSIASASPSGTNTVTFSSIPSTYKNLHIRIYARDAYSGGVLTGGSAYIQCNGDTGSNYSNHQMYANGTSFTHGNQSGATYMRWDETVMLGSTANPHFGVGIFEISDYASTTKTKTGIGSFGVINNTTSANFEVGVCSGFWNSTSAITSLTISTDYNLVSGSLITLYGVN